jgi:hypothetical protein
MDVANAGGTTWVPGSNPGGFSNWAVAQLDRAMFPQILSPRCTIKSVLMLLFKRIWRSYEFSGECRRNYIELVGLRVRVPERGKPR